MITVHREYTLQTPDHPHAHVEVCPTGVIEVEIVESKECYSCDLDRLAFKDSGSKTKLVGLKHPNKNLVAWEIALHTNDATELVEIVAQVNEEYETLMNDLM
ncbi:hypothetical protein OAP63_08425 [Vibrio sp.]|uniref:Uncharacterized protein n=1 Tax=Vibrio viridaestus TaxID=2487322 RepID=A0A3N9THI8_9VIBR|nr:hypothetical protein [Vibrio viridaestus]MDC0610746.1 hypothetical protein [Vibrio sp.]RQW63629.1 hypothetical protein EES38_10305 [Vibrio viridaestus]